MNYAVLLLVVVLGAQANARVVVNRQDPVVKTRHFDPRKPPKEMPPLDFPEIAVTDSKVQAAVGFSTLVVEEKKNADGTSTATVKVTAAQVDLTAAITIWLPLKVDKKTTIHEEAHRQIAEHYYGSADQKASQIARTYIDRTFSATAPTSDEAANAAMQKGMEEFGREFMKAFHEPMSRTQQIFDRITDHGRNTVDEQKAIEQAIKEAAQKR